MPTRSPANRTPSLMFLSAALGGVIACVPVTHPYAQQPDLFNQIVVSIYQDAAAKGVSRATLDRALYGIQPVDGLKRLENFQPEHVKSFTEYYRGTVTAARIQRGQTLLRQHAHALAHEERVQGIPAQYILAIWAMETNFGDNMGSHSIIPALVTLARDGKNQKRRDYFKAEAINALTILDQGYDQVLTAKGSWAGAFGHTQFMPSSFLKLAADGDGDGRKDVWNNMADVFASTANYLARNNWQPGERWGRAVKLPPGFDTSLLMDKLAHQVIKTPSEWAQIGVRQPDGSPLPGDNTMRARMIAPDGISGPTYMVYDNFISIMRYNSSYKYALSVAGLADGIAGARSALGVQPLNQ